LVWLDALSVKVREQGRVVNTAALVARGLSGVRLVISDAHQGLVDAVASVLEGASWQRCRTH
jgi:putative transposase